MDLLLPAPGLAGGGVETALQSSAATPELAIADGRPTFSLTRSLRQPCYRALHRTRQTPAYIRGWRSQLAMYDRARAKSFLKASGRFVSRVILQLPTDDERLEQSWVLLAEFQISETRVASVGRGADP